MLVRQAETVGGWAVIQRAADGNGGRDCGIPETQGSAMTRWFSEHPPLWFPIGMLLPPRCPPQALLVTPVLFKLTVSHSNQILCVESA